MPQVGQKRPWLAVMLAVLQPGLGHVYLRRWWRAMLWFALAITTALVFVPEMTGPAPETIQGVIDTVVATRQSLPAYAVAALFSVRLLNTLDAYWLALRGNAAEAMAGESCPACGKEVDDDLDFCHWCTTRLDGDV